MQSDGKQMRIDDLLKAIKEPSRRERISVNDYEEFVKKNRSGIMSAFIKAMRMQKERQAMYFGALLLLGNMSKWYVSRRVMISAGEDSVDPDVMKYTAEMFKTPEKKKTAEDVLKGAVAVCSGHTWWNTRYGRTLMREYFKAGKMDLKKPSLEDYLSAMEEELEKGGAEGFRNTCALWANAVKLEEFDYVKHFEWLADMCGDKGARTNDQKLIALGDVVRTVITDLHRYKDWNWGINLYYLIAVGSPEEQLFKVDELAKWDEIIPKIIDIAEEDLLGGSVAIPPWAYDKMHASNQQICPWGDRRFAGNGPGFYNSILQFKKYGRLDPRDQAVLDNLRVPEEGLVLGNEHVEEVH